MNNRIFNSWRICLFIAAILISLPAFSNPRQDRIEVLKLVNNYYKESTDTIAGSPQETPVVDPKLLQNKVIYWSDYKKFLQRYFSEEIIEGQRFAVLRVEAGLKASVGISDYRYPKYSGSGIGGPFKQLKIWIYKLSKDSAQVRVLAFDPYTVGASWEPTEYWLIKRKGLWRIADQSVEGFFKGSPSAARRHEPRLKRDARFDLCYYQKISFNHLLRWWSTGEAITVSPGETQESFRAWSRPYELVLAEPPIRTQAPKSLQVDRYLTVLDLLEEDRRDTFKEAILRIKAWDQCPPEFKTLPGDWNEPGTGKGGTRTLEELYRDWKRITWEYSPLAKQQATEKK